MATNTVYVTAGLPVAKNAAQSPGAGENTVYVTAGLPPVVEAAGGTILPQMLQQGLYTGAA